MALLNVGIDLSGRKLTANLPTDTSFSYLTEDYIIAWTTNNYIIYESKNDHNLGHGVFYKKQGSAGGIAPLYVKQGSSAGVNYTQKVPDDFGTIMLVDDTAEAYPYLSRVDNEKAYLVSEDLNKVEIVSRSFTTTISSNIPANSIVSVSFDISSFGKLIAVTGFQADAIDPAAVGIVSVIQLANSIQVTVRNFTSSAISANEVDVTLNCNFINS